VLKDGEQSAPKRLFEVPARGTLPRSVGIAKLLHRMSHSDDEEPVSGVLPALDVVQDILSHERIAIHVVCAPILTFLNLLPRTLHVDKTDAKSLSI